MDGREEGKEEEVEVENLPIKKSQKKKERPNLK